MRLQFTAPPSAARSCVLAAFFIVANPVLGQPALERIQLPPGFRIEIYATVPNARSLALGMRFYTGTMFPPEYRDQIFIAEHGSWNRSKKSGYRISLVRLDLSGKVKSYETFAQGWLQGESASGRPVDLEVLPDGSLAVSDDAAGVIYRISHSRAP